MLTIVGQRNRYCGGVTRRSFLKIGACGASLTLADMLQARAADPIKKTREKSVIMICLFGGPPHQDMYDLKPDAPRSFVASSSQSRPTFRACRSASSSRCRPVCGTS